MLLFDNTSLTQLRLETDKKDDEVLKRLERFKSRQATIKDICSVVRKMSDCMKKAKYVCDNTYDSKSKTHREFKASSNDSLIPRGAPHYLWEKVQWARSRKPKPVDFPLTAEAEQAFNDQIDDLLAAAEMEAGAAETPKTTTTAKAATTAAAAAAATVYETTSTALADDIMKHPRMNEILWRICLVQQNVNNIWSKLEGFTIEVETNAGATNAAATPTAAAAPVANVSTFQTALQQAQQNVDGENDEDEQPAAKRQCLSV